MNTLFRICVYYCVALLIFTLAFNFVTSVGAFDVTSGPGITNVNEENLLSFFSDWSGGMNAVFGGFVILSFSLVVLLAWAFHSMIPIGIYIFSMIFWTSFLRAWGIFMDAGFLEGLQEFTFMFWAGTVFIFIGATVGMSTGSG